MTADIESVKAEDKATPSHRPKILIADDNQTHCTVMRKLLEKEGYEIAMAQNGESALIAFDEWVPDLVILDSMLPQKCGMECLQYIRSHPRKTEVRVVMCSAKSDIDYVLACLEAGADGFVFKPFETVRFRRRIKHILGEE
jgi:DNA-binding response OmpR family regulator